MSTTLDAETEPSQKQGEVDTPHNQPEEGKWFIEDGTIFEGSKEDADRYTEHVKVESAKKQFDLEASINKASDRPLRSREEAVKRSPYEESLVREQGFLDHEFTSLAAGTANRLAESFESGDLKDSSDAKEEAKLHRGVVDLLDSESAIGGAIDQHLAQLESQLETYRSNRVPTAGVEWKVKVALKAKEILEEQKKGFEDRAKDIASGEHWETEDTHGDIEEARKIVANEWTANHNDDLVRRRAESPSKKQEVIQNARTTAARSEVDEALDAAKRVIDLPGESETPKTPQEAEAMINTSPDLMLELLAEAHAYADERANATEDPNVHERLKKEQGKLEEIAESFRELANLWRTQGTGKTYEQFYEELNDTNTDRTVLSWLANTSPGQIYGNTLVANRKLAMMKRMSNPRT